MGRIDLHIHTLCSDGMLTPFEVVDEALKNQVECIAIADHDTLSAYSPELMKYAKKKEILLIPAVEISATWEKIGFHILGYNIDLSNSYLQESLLKLKNARSQYLLDVANKLNKHGYKLNIDVLNQNNIVTKAHIAQNVVENPINKNLLLKEFLHIPQKGEFIEKIMNENCPCYAEKYTISLKDAVDLIRVSGGFPVLAHPMAYQYENNIFEDKILELIQETGITAIEGNYVYVDKNGNKHNDTKKWNIFAEKYNLLSTVGSDFHFFDGVRPEIGLIHENLEHIDSSFIIEEIIKNSH